MSTSSGTSTTRPSTSVRVVVVEEGQLRAPAGGDDGRAAGQGLHQRPAPALAARRRDVRVGGGVEAGQVGLGDRRRPRTGCAAAAPAGTPRRPSSAATRRLDRLQRGVERADLEHERHVLLAGELQRVGAQQHVPALAVLEVEVRDEGEAARLAEVDRRRVGVEAVEVDGARQDAQALAIDAAALEAVDVELRRHPDAVERRRASSAQCGGSTPSRTSCGTTWKPARRHRAEGHEVQDVDAADVRDAPALAAAQHALGVERQLGARPPRRMCAGRSARGRPRRARAGTCGPRRRSPSRRAAARPRRSTSSRAGRAAPRSRCRQAAADEALRPGGGREHPRAPRARVGRDDAVAAGRDVDDVARGELDVGAVGGADGLEDRRDLRVDGLDVALRDEPQQRMPAVRPRGDVAAEEPLELAALEPVRRRREGRWPQPPSAPARAGPEPPPGPAAARLDPPPGGIAPAGRRNGETVAGARRPHPEPRRRRRRGERAA